MPAKPPILDARALSDILSRLQAQSQVNLPQWTPPPEGDAGAMLQRIFARLMEIAIERLNRVPEKNMLAFLDAMGVSVLSPSAAEAPVTFSLLKNTSPTVIPKGTQAGTKPGGQTPTLIFETTEDFTVIPGRLTSAFTMDPVWDRYADQTTPVAGQSAVGFTPFVGTGRMPHILYAGDDALLNFSRAVNGVLSFAWRSGRTQAEIVQFLGSLAYQYLSQGILKTVPASVSVSESQAQVTLALPDPIDSSSVQGLGLAQAIQNRWLQAVLTAPFPDAQVARDLQLQGVALTVSSAASFFPDLAFSDNAPIDLTKEFYPFGQTPGVGSTFYIASQDAFAKPNSKVTLHVNLKPVTPPVLIWEFWDGSKWSQLPAPSVVDGTNGFTRSGKISLLVPANVPQGGPTGGIAAWSNVWVRARVIGGAYRGAPSFTSFTLRTSAKLAAAAAASSSKILLDTSNFVAQGQVVQVDNDYAVVVGVSDKTLTLAPALPNGHGAGASVGLRLTTPVATLSQAVAAGATQINAGVTGPISQNSVLLVDDNIAPEFITVKQVQQANDNAGAVLPGILQITATSPLQSGHGKGVSLASVAAMNVHGLANGSWLDLSKEFFPLGTSPGPGDFFLMYTFGGFFASIALAATTTGAVAAPLAVETTPTLLSSTLSTGLSASNTGIILKGTGVEKTIATESISNRFGGIFVGGIGLLTNPHLFGPQMQINIDVTVKATLPDVGIQWEFLGAGGWQAFTPVDATSNFLTDGANPIVLPLGACVLGEVNSKKSHWVRARITRGNYGMPLDYVAVDPADPSKGYQIRQGTGNLHPPILIGLTLDYTTSRTPTSLLIQNGFLYADQTSADSGGFVPFLSVKDLTPIRYADPEPAFYLGFDQAFPQQPVKFYGDAAPRAFSGSVLKEISVAPSLLADLPGLKWEYFNGTAWTSLLVLDGTNNLTESGAVEFLTPLDIQPLARFDATERYWIRARSARNDPFNTQQLDGVFLNTTTALQAVTVAGETLGSSNGQASQTFRQARPPDLPGQQVWVREPEQPSGEEAAELQAEEGSDAIQQRLNTVTQQAEVWVRWHEVGNFLASEPFSRHYTLDHNSGRLTFGDGQRGLIPPLGTHNIVAAYRSGGGAAGNLPKGAIAQIKSALPGVGSVSNPVASDGGADAETGPMVEARGPQVFKHRGHAVAAGDLEWLAREAAGTRVARAKCLPNVNRDLAFEPGWVTLLIVPRGADARLSPGSQLLAEVETYLTTRAFIGLAQQAPARVNVIGPGYIQVVVAAEVVPVNVEEAQAVKQRVLNALTAYLHPLTGGPQGTGWEFGQPVYASKVNQLIENVAGVDHVAALQLIPSLAQHRLSLDPSGHSTVFLPQGSQVVTPDGRKSALLAEPGDVSTGRIFVKAFKDGDRIAKVVDVTVISAAGTMVNVAPFTADSVGVPRGSVVMTFSGRQSTRLAQGILPGQNVASISFETPLNIAPGDVLSLFYPFPITISSVTLETLPLTVTSVAGGTITVAPFTTDVDLPVGTLLTTPDGTRRSPLVQAIAGGSTGVTQVVVQDASFAAPLSLGDSVLVQLPSQRLGIEPYEPELPFPAGSLVATLDNRVRLPLLAGMAAGQAVTSVRLKDFASGGGDSLAQVAGDGPGGSPVLTVLTVEPVYDVVNLDDNFLVYSGPHEIVVVEK